MRPLLSTQGIFSKWSSRFFDFSTWSSFFSSNRATSRGSQHRKSWYGINTVGFGNRYDGTVITATANSTSNLPLQTPSGRGEDGHLNHGWNWDAERNGTWTNHGGNDWDCEQQGGGDNNRTRRMSSTQIRGGYLPSGIMVLNEVTVIGETASDEGRDNVVAVTR
jgi:hypothetical protein